VRPKTVFKCYFSVASDLLLRSFCSSQIVILVCLVGLEVALRAYFAVKRNLMLAPPLFFVERFSTSRKTQSWPCFVGFKFLLLEMVVRILFYYTLILVVTSVDLFFELHSLILGFVLPFLVATEALVVAELMTEFTWFESRFPRFSFWVRRP